MVMKIFLTLLLACFSFSLWATSDLNFTYSYTPPNGRNFNLELYEISKAFENKNFLRLSSFPSGNIPMIHADEVMYSTSHKGSIFIKVDLVAPANLHYKIVEGEGFYLYHTSNASLAFFDFTRDEVVALTTSLKKDLVSKTNFFSIFINSATAADQVEGCRANVINNFNGLEMITNTLSYNMLLKKLGECGVNAMKGMNGQIDSTIAFFKKLKDSPGQLWKEMKESFEHLKYFITNIASELKSFYTTMRDLSIDDQLEIGCKMIGEAIPGLALMATGAGIAAGTTRLIAVMIPKMQRLQRLMMILKRHGLPITVAKETLSCAI
jgi:hypothetical protein